MLEYLGADSPQEGIANHDIARSSNLDKTENQRVVVEQVAFVMLNHIRAS